MKIVRESINFKRHLDPKDTMNIGLGPKFLHSKSYKILNFIREAGEEGRSYMDIIKFIYFEVNGAPYGLDYFKNGRGRGYWASGLYTRSDKKRGLLNEYCRKNDKGKWVFVRFPSRNENIFLKK